MAAKNQIEVEIRARNEASGALDRAFSDLDKTRRGAVEFAQAFGNLNPVLSQTMFAISDFTRATRGVDVGLRASVVTVGLLTLGFAAYARAVQQSIAAQVAFNQALHSADVGTLRSQLSGLNTELATMAATLSKVGANEGFGQALRNIVGLITAAPGALAELLGFTTPPEKRQAELVQELTTQLTIQGARERAEVQGKFAGGTLQRIQMEQQRLVGLGYRGGFQVYAPEIETAARAQLDQQLDALRIAEQQELAKTFAGGAAAGPEADLIRGRYQGQRRLLRQAAETAGAARAIAGESQERAERVSGAQIDAERLQIARDRIALTATEKASMDLLVIQQQRVLELEVAGSDVRKKALADFRAQAETAAKLREEFERTDFFGGMSRGFRETREHFTAFGEAGADAVRRFASTAERTMSDLFFLPIERGWRKTFEELPKQVGLAALRILTDTFARMSIGSLLRGTGLGGLATAGLSLPGLGPGVAQAGVLNVAGRSATELAQLQQAGYQIVQTPNGQQLAIPTPNLTSFTPGGGGDGGLLGTLREYWNTPVFQQEATAFGMPASQISALYAQGYTTAEIAAMAQGPYGYAYGATGAEAASSAVTYGQVAGYAGAVVAAGYTAYTAYQSGSPGMGALQGGTTGLMIGAYFGGPYGAAVGLVIGAAVGAGLGALGKQRPSAMQRRQVQTQQVLAGARVLVDRLNATATVDEALAVLTFFNTGSVGGRSAVAVVTTVAVNGVQKFIGDLAYDGRPYPVATREEVLANLETLRVSIQGGEIQSAVDDANEMIRQAIISKLRQLAEPETRLLFGYEEAFAVTGVPGTGVTRATVLPFTRAEEARGRQLLVFEDLLIGLDDTTLEQLLYRLAQVDADRSLGIIRRDDEGTIVTLRTRPAPPAAPPTRPPAAASTPSPSPQQVGYGYGPGTEPYPAL